MTVLKAEIPSARAPSWSGWSARTAARTGTARGGGQAPPQRVGHLWIAAPGPTQDDLFGVCECDRRSHDPGDGPCDRLEGGEAIGLPHLEGGAHLVHVDGGGSGPAQPELRKHLGQRRRQAMGTDGHKMGDLTCNPTVSTVDLTVGHDRAAETFAEVDVDEIVEPPFGGAPFGPSGPVESSSPSRQRSRAVAGQKARTSPAREQVCTYRPRAIAAPRLPHC